MGNNMRFRKAAALCLAAAVLGFSGEALHAQRAGTPIVRENGRFVDLVGTRKVREVTVDRDTVKLGYPSAVNAARRPDDLTALYVSLSREPRLILKRSHDGGLTWGAREYPAIGNDDRARVVSLAGIADKKGPLQLHIFRGAGELAQSVSSDGGHTWTPFEPVNGFGGFRVTDAVQFGDGSCMAFFNDDGRFISDSVNRGKSVIYKIVSRDQGRTWSRPEVALKHNLYGLTDAAVAVRSRRKGSTLVMIVNEPVNRASLVSFSHDEGKTWSYPVELPPVLHGDRHRILIDGRKAYVVFRDTRNLGLPEAVNDTFGDMMLWVGDLRDLERGTRGLALFRIADNYPGGRPDPADLDSYDAGYPSILHTDKGRIAVVAYGRWEKDAPAYIKCFVVNPERLW